MDLVAHFQMLARYNKIANERLFEACARLEPAEYRKQRQGSFGSIHGLLNHLLLGDQIWMARFEGNGHETPRLNIVLFDEFSELRSARVQEDARIEEFFYRLDGGLLSRRLGYTNHQGREYVDEAPIAISHFFNHQTHHRGQVHVMLSQTAVATPSLDLHRIINP
jgi:uncharacterized damage-inducible protein DinB